MKQQNKSSAVRQLTRAEIDAEYPNPTINSSSYLRVDFDWVNNKVIYTSIATEPRRGEELRHTAAINASWNRLLFDQMEGWGDGSEDWGASGQMHDKTVYGPMGIGLA